MKNKSKTRQPRSSTWLIMLVVIAASIIVLVLVNNNLREQRIAIIPSDTFIPITMTSVASPVPTIAPVTKNADWKAQDQSFDGVEMVLVPPGCFDMGSFNGQANEKPITKTCFNDPFWIDKTAVTQSQFDHFGGKAAKSSYFRGNNRPVEQITWFEARDFCAKRGGRLPTEAEREYAARGPDDLGYPWGNDLLATNGTDLVNQNSVYVANSNGQTADVGSKSGASWIGALDMIGNVQEWTSSLYQPYPYNAQDGRENGTDTSNARVLRGASWSSTLAFLSATNRVYDSPTTAINYYGFRCARSF